MASLRELRRQQSLSQLALAVRAGVGQSTISRAELGARPADEAVAGRIAQALDARVEEIDWTAGTADPERGKRHPPIPWTCDVCRTVSPLPPSIACQRRRCDDCLAAGHDRCITCQHEFQVIRQTGRPGRCEACQKGRAVAVRRVERVNVTCTGYSLFGEPLQHAERCRREYEYTPARLYQVRTYDRRTRTFLSLPCSAASKLPKNLRGRLRKAGYIVDRVRSRNAVTKWSRAFGRSIAERHPPTGGVKGVVPPPLARARAEGNYGNQEKKRRSLLLAAWRRHAPDGGWRRRENRWRFGLCCWCRKGLLYHHLHPHRFHGRCLREAQRSPAGTQWLKNRRRDLRQGAALDEVREFYGPQLPGKRWRGHPPAVEELTRDFGWTVRYLLGKEKQTDLAEEAHVSRSDVSHAIKDLLALLPDLAIAAPKFRPYIAALEQEVQGDE